MLPSLRRALLASVSLLVLLAAFAPTAANAHAGDQSYLYIDLDIGASPSGRLEMPFIDVREHLGLELTGSDDEIAAEIEANADLLWQYTQDHVQIGRDGVNFTFAFVRAEHLYGIEYLGVTFDVETSVEAFDEPFDVSLDPFFDEDENRDALFIVENDWDRGFVNNEGNWLLRFTPDSRSQSVDLGESSNWRNFSGSVGLGVDHIRTGADHILFVAVLLLPSVLIYLGGWHLSSGFSSSLWRLLKLVSMFTLAHSITFSLVGLGLFPDPPGRLVESVIALSIGVAAIHNLFPVIPAREWLIAFGFGLFHGLGFASLVVDLDVSTSTKLISLAGRNVGIEIGQAVVVLMLFPILYLLRRTVLYRPLFISANVLLAIEALGWFIERVFGGPAPTTKVLTQVFLWPRVLWIWVGLFVATLIVFGWYRQKGELRPEGAALSIRTTSGSPR